MKMYFPGREGFKHLLLMTIFCHYYSGLVTSADPVESICADIAANKSVNFFLVAFSEYSYTRTLITAKPNFLVYDLSDSSVQEDTVNIYGVKPFPLKNYYPRLFKNEKFVKLIDSQGSDAVTTYTVDQSFTWSYLHIIFVSLKLLFRCTSSNCIIDEVENFTLPALATQQFVSSRDYVLSQNEKIYSFLNQPEQGPIGVVYKLNDTPSVISTTFNYTCKAKETDNTLVWRSNGNKCGDSYDDFDWAESPKGWATRTSKTNIRFHLFFDKHQEVYIFDQDDENINSEGDVFSVVRKRSYKDFFWCQSGTPPTPTPTPSIPTQSSTTVNATTEVTEQTTTVPTTPTPPKNGICADIAANKSVDFFLVGFHQFPYVRLLITAKPDYLVYKLYENMIDEDTINIYDVTPISLKDYYPELFQNKKFVEAFDSQCDVKTYTIDIGGNWCHFSIFFPGFELLIRYLLDVYIVKENDDFNPPISTTQQFVSSRDYVLFQDQKVYSFLNEPLQGPILMEYKIKPDITPVKYSFTCKANQTDTIVWLSSDNKKCPDSDDEWDWTESPKGWARRSSNANIRFHLFSRKKQQVYIFDKDDRDVNSEGNVFSVVRKRSYKDFFWCFSGNPTPAPTQPSTTTTSTTKVPKRTTTVQTTSAQPVTYASSTAKSSSTPVPIPSVTTYEDTSLTARSTSTEKPSSTIWWIIVLILVFLVVIITIVVFLVWYYSGSEKAPNKTLQFESSDEKFDKIASKEFSTLDGNPATNNVLSTQVIPSKVASSVKAQSFKYMGTNISHDDAKISKLSSIKGQTNGGANFVDSKEKSAIVTKQVSGVCPTGIQLNVKSEAASTISIQSSIMDNSKGSSAQM